MHEGEIVVINAITNLFQKKKENKQIYFGLKEDLPQICASIKSSVRNKAINNVE